MQRSKRLLSPGDRRSLPDSEGSNQHRTIGATTTTFARWFRSVARQLRRWADRCL